MAYSVKTFDTIIEEFDKAQSWFQKVLNLADGTGRLGAIQTEISRIKGLVESGISEEELFRQVDQITAYHSWIDALGFIRIWQGLSGLSDQELPRSLLRRANKGLLSPEQESLDNSDARNVFFQLEYAADLILKGMKIEHFDDLEFDFLGTRYVAECKRLWSDKSQAVRRNINRAAQQLVKHLDQHSARPTRGLIVLALDKIAGLSTALPMEVQVVTESDVLEYTRRITAGFRDFYGVNLAGLDVRITAAIVVCRTPAHTLTDNTFGPIFIPTVVPLVADGTRDHRRLRRLVQALNG